MLLETRVSHLVKSEDLNHHGTLFAGRGAEWLVESCFICAARLVGKPEDVVCVQIHGMSFHRPIRKGGIVELNARIAMLGGKSITVAAQALVDGEEAPAAEAMATFVTVDHEGKAYPHGLTLPSDYIEANRAIHEAAQKLRRSR